MTSHELAREFAELWDELDPRDINTMLAKNVPFELLEFFQNYAEQFVRERGYAENDLAQDLRQQLPTLMIIAYLIRVLEERID